MVEKDKIDLRSDEITEILGVPPRWLVRWGITVLFIVIAIVFIGSAFFSYPDIVSAPVVISSENPPSSIIARSSGKPDAIFFRDGSDIRKGDTLAVIENPASYRDIFRVSQLISGFKPDVQSFQNLNLDTLRLGDVQTEFNSFSRALSDYSLFARQKLHEQKIRSLEEELKQSKILYDRLWSQRNLVMKDLKLTEKQFARDSQLFRTGVIPAVEFEKSQAVLINKRQSLESARLSLSNASISIEKLKQSIVDTRFDEENQRKQLEEVLQNAINQLRSSLKTWEKNYLLVATSTGKLTYMTLWSSLQEVKAGDKVFTINPVERGEVQARLTIPFERAGKVKVGQIVNIKLDGYPYLEYGMVEGVIKSISSGSTENGFPAVVELTEGICTSYGHKVEIERELSGIAEITTEELTLLQRLLSPLKHLFKNRFLPA